MLNNFKASIFKFTVFTKEELVLPSYKGSTFRGSFGHILKKVTCNQETVCQDCTIKDNCLYSYIFETPPPEDSIMMRKYPSVPHPFIIEPPEENKRLYMEGDEINFNLVLLGKAIDFFPYFVYTFEEMGKTGLGKSRGKYELSKIYNINPLTEEKEQVFDTKGRIIKVPPIILDKRYIEERAKEINKKEFLKFNFITPLRIKYNNRFLNKKLDFHQFFPSLLRRQSALAYFHYGEEWDLDYKGLINNSREIKTEKSFLEWQDWERYSSRQKTKMKLGGLVGEVLFSGDFSDTSTFIALGEILHGGKNASFGLGKYSVN